MIRTEQLSVRLEWSQVPLWYDCSLRVMKDVPLIDEVFSY